MSGFPSLKKYIKGDKTWFDNLTDTVNRIMSGKINTVNTVTLSSATTQTVVTLSNGQLGPDTHISFEPKSANSASELYSGDMYVSARDVGANTFTISHSSVASATRTFSFTLTG